MTGWHAFFVVVAIISIAYFAALNGLYLVFTVIATRSVGDHLRRRTYGTLEEAFSSPFTPGITVIMPAFNEAAGVVESVRSLLDLRYPRYELIVVNDGSTDGTLARLAGAFELAPAVRALRDRLPTGPVRGSYTSRRHPELCVLDKENGGKADALNAGLNAARYGYVCSLDADALIEPDALLQVAAPILEDPEHVVAAGGIVRIANGCTIDHGRITEIRLPRSRLATLQVIEYFRAFLIGRVGWTRLNALLIISGAFALYLREPLEDAGGYWPESSGEDVEVVVRLHQYFRDRKLPYRMVFVPDPVCWTEVPEDMRSLGTQRRRWHRAVGQTLLRHWRAIGRPRYGAFGMLALPYFLFFEFLGPLVEILGPVIIILAAATGQLSVLFLVAFLVIAFGVGILLTLAALALEEFNFRRHRRGRDIARMMLYAVLENIGFRQVNDFWRTIGMIDVLRGKGGWGAQRRRGIGRPAAAAPGPAGSARGRS